MAHSDLHVKILSEISALSCSWQATSVLRMSWRRQPDLDGTGCHRIRYSLAIGFPSHHHLRVGICTIRLRNCSILGSFKIHASRLRWMQAMHRSQRYVFSFSPAWVGECPHQSTDRRPTRMTKRQAELCSTWGSESSSKGPTADAGCYSRCVEGVHANSMSMCMKDNREKGCIEIRLPHPHLQRERSALDKAAWAGLNAIDSWPWFFTISM